MPSLLERLIVWFRAMGAKTEADSERDGFLSYKSETHAVGMAIAGGFVLAAHGDAKLAGLVYGAAVYGRSYGEKGKRLIIIQDIIREPQYALGALVFGVFLGILARLIMIWMGVEIPAIPGFGV